MRVEICGAQITDAVVEVIEELQTNAELTKLYVDTLDEMTRTVILDIEGLEEKDAETLGRIRVLQMLRRDILKIATPPDVDDPANDVPAAQL